MPNWAEQVTAIATAVGAVGLLSAIGASIYAGQQVREARIGRQAEVASDFFRRWDEQPMVECRRLVAAFKTREDLRDGFLRHIAANDIEAYILFRELDYFERPSAVRPSTRCTSGSSRRWGQRSRHTRRGSGCAASAC